jgi:hypothetical protein
MDPVGYLATTHSAQKIACLLTSVPNVKLHPTAFGVDLHISACCPRTTSSGVLRFLVEHNVEQTIFHRAGR